MKVTKEDVIYYSVTITLGLLVGMLISENWLNRDRSREERHSLIMQIEDCQATGGTAHFINDEVVCR